MYTNGDISTSTKLLIAVRISGDCNIKKDHEKLKKYHGIKELKRS